MSNQRNTAGLDRFDRRILEVLQADGRISNQALAEAVNLSPSPCLRRVRALEAAGLITGYRAEVDARALGYGLVALLLISMDKHTPERFANFEARVAELPEVQEMPAHHRPGGRLSAAHRRGGHGRLPAAAAAAHHAHRGRLGRAFQLRAAPGDARPRAAAALTPGLARQPETWGRSADADGEIPPQAAGSRPFAIGPGMTSSPPPGRYERARRGARGRGSRPPGTARAAPQPVGTRAPQDRSPRQRPAAVARADTPDASPERPRAPTRMALPPHAAGRGTARSGVAAPIAGQRPAWAGIAHTRCDH